MFYAVERIEASALLTAGAMTFEKQVLTLTMETEYPAATAEPHAEYCVI